VIAAMQRSIAVTLGEIRRDEDARLFPLAELVTLIAVVFHIEWGTSDRTFGFCMLLVKSRLQE
jgi:hypothetical protein